MTSMASETSMASGVGRTPGRTGRTPLAKNTDAPRTHYSNRSWDALGTHPDALGSGKVDSPLLYVVEGEASPIGTRSTSSGKDGETA
jgi:hypothetical protein